MTTRICKHCGLTQPIEAFSHHPTSKGGRRARCRTCETRWAQQYRKAHPRALRPEKLFCGPIPEGMKACRKCCITKPLESFHKFHDGKFGRHSRCKVCRSIYAAAHRPKGRCRCSVAVMLGRRAAASSIVACAINYGRLRRPAQCELCGETHRMIVAHHEDYDSPLLVNWLCSKCHRWIHLQPISIMRNEWDMPLCRQHWVDHDVPYDAAIPERPVIDVDVRHALMSSLSTLTNREREIIERRYGRDDTLESVGIALGLTRARIQQMEVILLKKLRYRITALAPSIKGDS